MKKKHRIPSTQEGYQLGIISGKLCIFTHIGITVTDPGSHRFHFQHLLGWGNSPEKSGSMTRLLIRCG